MVVTVKDSLVGEPTVPLTLLTQECMRREEKGNMVHSEVGRGRRPEARAGPRHMGDSSPPP